MNVDNSSYRIAIALMSLFALGYLVYLLSPVLTPFLIAAFLAYMGDPVTDRLEKKVSRTWAVVIVFCIISILSILMLLILVPLLERQISQFFHKAPQYISGLETVLAPWMQEFGFSDFFNQGLNSLADAIKTHWQQAGNIAAGILSSITRSGLAFFAWVANIVLIPVVTFYLLRDWDFIVAHLHELLPRGIEPEVVRFVKESDAVLGSFVRGQLLVMLVLGLIYALGLFFVGLDFGILIGVLAGVVSFVPYLGFIVGILTAGLAVLIQFHDLWHLLLVFIVFFVGQLAESLWLTPMLVGDRIGLHPVAVIFAVLAGGQLFGFFGILLALPVASVVMVFLRFVHAQYKNSHLYCKR